MNDFSFLSIRAQWSPFEKIGITHWFFSTNIATLMATGGVFVAIIATLFLCRFFLNRKNKVACFLITTGIEAFMNLCTQTLGYFDYGHFSFITALFLFILYCNLIGVVPFFEEPTADLNTTLALGTISFAYITFHAIKKHGFKAYIGEYFEPFFLMFPLNVVGKLASIISISFRLFGNLLGGSVITKIFLGSVGTLPSSWYFGLIPIVGVFLSAGVYIFFGVFEGFIQAFVFAMLSLTYLSTEIAEKD